MGSQLKALRRKFTRDESCPVRIRFPKKEDSPSKLAENFAIISGMMIGAEVSASKIADAHVLAIVEYAKESNLSLNNLIVRLGKAWEEEL